MNLFTKKPIDVLLAQANEEGEHTLKRGLGPINLTMLGIGSVIGAGIFVLTGQAAAAHAGPAIVLSFVLAGVVCTMAALCYAELASMIPVAGSAYTYTYATLGEFVAWIIAWDLILEYGLAAATVGLRGLCACVGGSLCAGCAFVGGELHAKLSGQCLRLADGFAARAFAAASFAASLWPSACSVRPRRPTRART